MRWRSSGLGGLALIGVWGCTDRASREVGSEGGVVSRVDAGDGEIDAEPDARVGSCGTRLECVGPPIGCHYVGGDGCTSCGSIVCADAGGSAQLDGGAVPRVDAGTEVGADASSAAPDASIGCGVDAPRSFPRSCVSQEDCVAFQHQIDCCGTQRAYGIRSDQGGAFSSFEAACRAAYPACGCPEPPTQADDGTTSTAGQPARAACVAGVCTATFSAINVESSCTAGGTPCGLGYSCCYPCGIPGCSYQCVPSCAPGSAACYDGCRAVP